ncbi:MAG: von Willebrand factor type A domain-containing protein [Bacteroidales bacterium]
MKNIFKIFVLLNLAAILISFTGSLKVKGRVTDSEGSPIAGVTVAIAGTATGTVTDINGEYTISVTDENGKLVFTSIGYKKLTVEINGRSMINVQMESEVLGLSEVVVTGYGIQRKQDVTGSVRIRGISSALNGRVSGVITENKSMAPAIFNADIRDEGYSGTVENGFKKTTLSPLSTFSIDVDNASYSNIRRFINNGELPPAEAVRIEEMINYFKYDYPEPDGEHPFAVYTEMAKCPWNTSHYLLQVGLKGKSIDKRSLPASNIVFLIDVSGSMSDENKLPLLKSAFGLLVNELRPQDRVAIVVYAGAAGLVLESTPGNRKSEIMRAIDNLTAGGSTAGGAGLKLAYSVADRNFIEGGNNRIILATDGDFNVGESSNDGMERLVEQERGRGIFMTVLGFGMGNVKDDKMEIIADKGNGNYAYIDNLQEARRVLVKEFGGTLFTIAKDVKFQIEFNPEKISSYRLIGYENRLLNDEDFNNDRKDAGEMGSGHNVTALYELVPAGSDEKPLVDPLRYQKKEIRQERTETANSSEYLNIKIRYKNPDGMKSILMEKPVSGEVGEIAQASENLRFAAAVSEFGMILRDSEYSGKATLQSAVRLAENARGEDEEGYRAEMIRLVKLVMDMKHLSER